ncbi:MAG: hypothetical protein PWQ77_419 [Kosmotogales bacterium]|nr:hypothetical protein [Kosmotogales bacterium]
MKEKASKEKMKETNKKILYKEIYTNPFISRASLARKFKMSPATVTNLCSEMIEENLINEAGSSESTGGRKPIILKINENYKTILGIKIGVGYLNFYLSNLIGEKIFSFEIENRDYKNSESTIEKITEEFEKMIAERRMAKKDILGVGVSVSGIVDTLTGIVTDSHILNWRDVFIGKKLREKLGLNIYILNDLDSFALAQLWKGKASNFANCFFITVGSGIGGSMTNNGKLFSLTGAPLEIGHLSILKDGKLCDCGSKGCLEAQIGFGAITKYIYEETGIDSLKNEYKSLEMDEYSEIDYLRKAKKSDEKVFVKIFENYSYFLGLSLKNIINLFSPDYILIGGEAMEFKEYFLEKSIEIAKKNSFGRLSLKIVFDQDKLGEDSWVLGGIYRVIESNLF